MGSPAYDEHVKEGLELFRIEKKTLREWWLSSGLLHRVRHQMAEPRPVGKSQGRQISAY